MDKQKKPLIIYFAPWTYWERENRSQPLARALADLGHHVLYVNYPLGPRYLSRVKGLFVRHPFRRVQPRLHMTFGGPVLPTYSWRDMIYIPPEGPSGRQQAFVEYLVRIVGQEPFRGRELIVLSSRMISQLFARRVRPSLCAIDIEDPWSHFGEVWKMPRRELVPALRSFCGDADVVFANGHNIAKDACESFLDTEPQILLNGVDPGKFAPDPLVPRPPDYPPGPSIMYSGTVHERIDFDLLEPAFKAFPKINFIFLGGVFSHFEAQTKKLASRHPNVVFLGHREVGELPAYLQQADMFMMPSCLDEAWTRAFPAKLFEYFIFGKETISTFAIKDIPEEYQFAIRVAPDADSFISHLKEGLEGCPRGAQIAAYGRQQDWRLRAAQVARSLGL
ncbi:MAG: glycosyltransferase [Desulfarculaceae bacterium]|nr:glycosyltransferase [Desulfarculaceae bacterium]MCF8047014.1 glycosyltransferase [Desulfarculaceae bacterium]MCF8066749.1 glycosyltransferase [Desulfarculaceae bacterium]MCF8096514.1 glycosyltransferase [Desulfarculaceae bacterium]MCF8121768.1 glycosyltransferase [Desulfarculaceae bacterium]